MWLFPVPIFTYPLLQRILFPPLTISRVETLSSKHAETLQTLKIKQGFSIRTCKLSLL